MSSLLKTMSQRCVFGCQHCSFAALFAASFAASFAALFAAPRFAQHGISSPYVAMICLCGKFQVSQCCKRVFVWRVAASRFVMFAISVICVCDFAEFAWVSFTACAVARTKPLWFAAFGVLHVIVIPFL